MPDEHICETCGRESCQDEDGRICCQRHLWMPKGYLEHCRVGELKREKAALAKRVKIVDSEIKIAERDAERAGWKKENARWR